MNDLPPPDDRLGITATRKILGQDHAVVKKLQLQGVLPFWTDENGVAVFSRTYVQGLAYQSPATNSSLMAGRYLLRVAAEATAPPSVQALARAFWCKLKAQNPHYHPTALRKRLDAVTWVSSASMPELTTRKNVNWEALRKTKAIEWLRFGTLHYYDHDLLAGLAAFVPTGPITPTHAQLYRCKYLLDTGHKSASQSLLKTLIENGSVMRPRQAAEQLGISRTTLMVWRELGRIASYKVKGDNHLFIASAVSDLKQLIAAGQDGLLPQEAVNLLGVAWVTFYRLVARGEICRSNPGLGVARYREADILELKQKWKAEQSRANYLLNEAQVIERLTTNPRTLAALAKANLLKPSLLKGGNCVDQNAHYYDPQDIEDLLQARWCDPLGYEIVQRLRLERSLAGEVRYLNSWTAAQRLGVREHQLLSWKNLNLLAHCDMRIPGASRSVPRYPDLYLAELLYFAKGQPLRYELVRKFRTWCVNLIGS